MITIAVCDDNTEMEHFLAETIHKTLEKQQKIFDIHTYTGGQFLLYEIEDGVHYDLIFLDIEMPEIDGISLAEKVKTFLPQCLIIFITSYDKYVYDSFKVQPFRFIPKKDISDRLPAAIMEAVTWIEKNMFRFYQVVNQQGMERISIAEIGYIRHKEKYAYIEKMNGECVKVRKTLKRIFEELPDGDFIWLDKGYICNLSQIAKLEGSDAILLNDVRLQISRDRLAEVKTRLRKYWLHEVEA